MRRVLDSINFTGLKNDRRHKMVNTKAIGRVASIRKCTNISHLRVLEILQEILQEMLHLIGHQIRSRFWLGYVDLSSNKKARNSTKGEFKISKKCTKDRQRKFYKKGAKLATLKLHYCSTFGLFGAGILKRPPEPNVSQIRSRIHDTNARDADYEDSSPKRHSDQERNT